MEGMKILIVDDEPDIVEMLSYNIEKEGMKIHKAFNGKEAVKVATDVVPEVILLDMMLPDMDGIEVCEQIRLNPLLANSIIVFLSARGEDYSQIAAYKAGADDYIVKPIRLKILIQKIKVLLERQFKPAEVFDTDIKIDTVRFTVKKGDTELIIQKKEFELLALLLSAPQRVVRREEILRDVWGDAVIGDRTIDVHIRKLRKKLGDIHIETIKGVGYKFQP